jgi:hypothetical protein
MVPRVHHDEIMMRRPIASAAALLIACSSALAGDVGHWTLRTEIRGTLVEGMPLFWSKQQVLLLGRDGRLWDFAPGAARNFRKESSGFRSYSPAEIRALLEREFAGQLDVTSTNHYLVAHAHNQGSEWAERFENLYRSMVHYFSVHGMRVHEPEFPLVAIVWPRAADFYRYAEAQGDHLGFGVIGYYSPKSNRVVMFQAGDPAQRSADWRQNNTTIVHEAAHQTAFNTGLHNRFAPPPRWLAEGLGMLFEARGVYDSVNYPTFEDRVNRGRLAQFRKTQASGRSAGAWVELIGSDRMFEHDISAAYAESWAFSFFLSETQPARYDQFLARTAARADFQPYPQAARVADFKAVFGDNFPMLEADFLRFISAIR